MKPMTINEMLEYALPNLKHPLGAERAVRYFNWLQAEGFVAGQQNLLVEFTVEGKVAADKVRECRKLPRQD